MSNVICTTPMCTDGKASVEQMQRTFNVLIGNPAFDKHRFESTMQSIEQTFYNEYSVFDPYIPFNPACCTIAEIGKQADKLTADMLASVGSAPTGNGPSTGAPGFDLDQLTTVLGLVLGVIVVSNIAPLIKKRS